MRRYGPFTCSECHKSRTRRVVSNPGVSMPGAAIPEPAENQALGQGTQQGSKTILCPSTGRNNGIPPGWNEDWGGQWDSVGSEDGGSTTSVPVLGCGIQFLTLTKSGDTAEWLPISWKISWLLPLLPYFWIHWKNTNISSLVGWGG